MFPLLIGIGTPVLIIVVIMWVFRTRGTRDAAPIVRIALMISAAWAGLALLWGVVRTVLWFQPGIGIPFTVRTLAYWPVPESSDALATAGSIQLDGGFTLAQLTSFDLLSTPTRGILAVGDLLGTGLTVVIVGLIALACFRFIQGKPFAPELARLSLIAASVVLVGGIATQVVAQYGGTQALAEIVSAGLGPDGVQAAGIWAIDWWPVWLAIGLAAFSALMRHGTVLQRETEGLV
ncbi:hypothetical protein LK09_14545 [Microbacterium mangrovi]|uniref:DUF2975 domain-containing protein n=1 Tax=Microbacterium mangrovi TaxID=1348253 RepID=A0A0B2A4N6_9MICO|nr:hypothetical protein [Microbacterium mangrovi]KHK96562.1 hypothetical protein LK09_14545 [Microbacterium mangrovi]